MNYFFVFQNKTFYDEYRGGYLWAPQKTAAGKSVSHWDKMKQVRRGDIILHSYHKKMIAISIAKSDVYESHRPVELSAEWQQEGWRVDTDYLPFTKTIVTSNFKERFLEL